ncbi:hypothetical protein M758_UG151800 [Ceratodon purpureus]|nr:hypothetical protein M758_UG151800 [Ceratodon purpureus]
MYSRHLRCPTHPLSIRPEGFTWTRYGFNLELSLLLALSSASRLFALLMYFFLESSFIGSDLDAKRPSFERLSSSPFLATLLTVARFMLLILRKTYSRRWSPRCVLLARVVNLFITSVITTRITTRMNPSGSCLLILERRRVTATLTVILRGVQGGVAPIVFRSVAIGLAFVSFVAIAFSSFLADRCMDVVMIADNHMPKPLTPMFGALFN